ncbi:MFS transporter [Marinobacter sp. M3C]|uniref:MFS transporter n=1 Tax=unclassified Marinobacter TaxID=83889 RepID=UPI00200BFC3B|nr:MULTISPECIES: MFS transporter [unclassified Marinobacter]UQG55282.1 MFS transporter [Marinobacter sp. M4C]UQG59414.1 MFS transporter [Marinobacter sp. M3C]UQG64085.1 MFS transporter [Marinobacter sp. M2C]UQG68369.1 MFS transporter [Marinobacter sp. M1C]
MENRLHLQANTLSLLLALAVLAGSGLRLAFGINADRRAMPANVIGETAGSNGAGTPCIQQSRLMWRFAVSYSGVSASFIVLTLWLPHFLAEVYQLDVGHATLTNLLWVIPAALFHAPAIKLARRFGARRMMYHSLTGILIVTFMLSYPPTHYQVHGINREIPFNLSLGLPLFSTLMIALGLFLALGQAALFSQMPQHYPHKANTVAATLTMAGAILAAPMLLAFATVSDITGVWQTSFMLLFALALLTLLRMHLAIRCAERKEWASAAESADLPVLFRGR